MRQHKACRFLCSAQIQLHRWPEAVTSCERAVDAEPSAHNLYQLASGVARATYCRVRVGMQCGQGSIGSTSRSHCWRQSSRQCVCLGHSVMPTERLSQVNVAPRHQAVVQLASDLLVSQLIQQGKHKAALPVSGSKRASNSSIHCCSAPREQQQRAAVWRHWSTWHLWLKNCVTGEVNACMHVITSPIG